MNNDSQQNSNSGLQNKDGALFLRHWPMLLLVALVFIFLGDVWFGGRILILRDTFFGDTTYRIFIGRLMRAGSFPLWSSLSQCGIPFAASPFMCVLYPPNWFFLFPSFEWALRLWWTFHLVLAACSCYALARHWRLGVAASLLAGISFTFSTFFVAWMEFPFGWCCISWSPLVIFVVSHIIDRTAKEIFHHGEPEKPVQIWPAFRINAVLIAGLAVLLSMQVLVSVEFCYGLSFLVVAYGVMRWVWYGSWKVCALSVIWFALAGVIVLGLTMPQWLPTFEMMKFSVRAESVDPGFNLASMHPRHWLTLLLPFLNGRPGYPEAQ